jgi:hypothetical protein
LRTALGNNLDQSIRSIGADDIAIGFDLGPLAIDVPDEHDFADTIAIMEDADDLARGGRRKVMTHQRDIERDLFFRGFKRFFLGHFHRNVMAGAFQYALAQQGKFLVCAENKNFHRTVPCEG